MAEKKKKPHLPWGLSKETLQPNSVKTISQSKIKAFNVGRMNPLKKPSPFLKKKEEREEKKLLEAQQTAEVFEEFVASFEDAGGSSGKTFVRGSSSVKPVATGHETTANPKAGALYKPSSRFLQKVEEKPQKEEEKITYPSAVRKPPKKKGTEKKKSILELFREELKRSQDNRKERRAQREATQCTSPEPAIETPPLFNVEEYMDMNSKGSFDTGDPLTTNLYVGNINPKMNEDNLCQLFGKFGPLASVKVMWPRTEEEKARNKNCGFVAFMKREDADQALEHFKGTKIMDYEVQIGWGKAVRVPPQPIYVPLDKEEEESAKVPDPPSGLPFNAQPVISVTKASGTGGGEFGTVPPPGASEGTSDPSAKEDADPNASEVFSDALYNAIVRVVIPTDVELLRIVHRMIEFVIREGPMFEAMIMNRELNNPTYQFLFDNRSPSHVYYRWKLFSILQGDSPETWRIDEFRMFEDGSLWKPPPLKNLRSKVLPPLASNLEEDHISRRGQLSSRQRDQLENILRNLTMAKEKVKGAMVWCMDHADSAEEIVECISEALTISETPLPTKVARLYLVSDILVNAGSASFNSSNFKKWFEVKLMGIIEHFHATMIDLSSRIKGEQFKKRVLSILLAWDKMAVYHYNVVDKLRLTFIGKSTDDMEKQRAFDTVAALIGSDGGREMMKGEDVDVAEESLDGVPLAMEELDGEPLGSFDGVPLADPDFDGQPLVMAAAAEDDYDGIPMKSTSAEVEGDVQATAAVKSKWELVDYGEDSEESEGEETVEKSSSVLAALEREKLLAEVRERKRKMLREVEVKAMELQEALEASGSYSKTEITERVDKYREKLMQEAVEPKFSPPPSKGKRTARSRSVSPSTLDKYRLDDSPSARRKASPSYSRHESSSARRKRSPSPASRSHGRKRSATQSRSPEGRKHHGSKSKRCRSRSPAGRRRSVSPVSPASRRSISPISKRSNSWSPVRKSRSRSPPAKSSRRSKSPSKISRRSRSPVRSSRSRSPAKSSRRSRSPPAKSSRRSRSPPAKSSRRSRSPPAKSSRRSRSPPAKSSRRSQSPPAKSSRRSRSPPAKSSRRSRSPPAKSSRRSRSPPSKSLRRSRSPISRSRSRSPVRSSRRSRSPVRRSHSRSPPAKSSKRPKSPRHSRRRSKSPKSSSKHRSSPSSRSSKKSKKRSRSRSPHKSKSKKSKR